MFRSMALILILMGAVLCPREALALRCDEQLVTVGDDKIDVEALCGPPSFMDIRQEEVFVRVYQPAPVFTDKVGLLPEVREEEPGYQFMEEQFLYVKTTDEWNYNFGPNAFTQTLIFEDNVLTEIRDGSYGFEEIKRDDFSVRKGDTKFVVWMKYGPAAEIRKNIAYDVTRVRQVKDGYLYIEKHARPIVEEEWIYDLGPDKRLQKLTFLDDRLVEVEPLRSKGK